MIYFADTALAEFLYTNADRFVLRNFMCSVSIGRKVSDDLLPSADIMQQYQYNADPSGFYNAYILYLQTPNVLLGVMDIMMDNYYNGDVYIVTDLQHPFTTTLVECISDVIRLRYGLKCAIVYTIEDIVTFSGEDDIPPEKLPFFIADKEWFTYTTTDPNQIMYDMDRKENLPYERTL